MSIKSYCLLLVLVTAIACKVKEEVTVVAEPVVEEPKASQSEALADKIIVNMQPDYTPEELAADYSQYGLVPKSRTNRKLNAWLFTFDPETISRKKLLNILNDNQYVKKAKGLGGHKAGSELSKSTHKQRAKVPTK